MHSVFPALPKVFHAFKLSNLILATSLTLGLTACNNQDEILKATGSPSGVKSRLGAIKKQRRFFKYSIAVNGPDVCFRKVKEKLEETAKVSDIYSSFGAGDGLIGGGSDSPKGALLACSVKYQNPDNQNELMEVKMDVHTGEFNAPEKTEITVGNASKFMLDDHLISVGDIDLSTLKSFMDSQDETLRSTYSNYAWRNVALIGTISFGGEHHISIRASGRIKSNDIEESSTATLSLAGKVIENRIGE